MYFYHRHFNYNCGGFLSGYSLGPRYPATNDSHLLVVVLIIMACDSLWLVDGSANQTSSLHYFRLTVIIGPVILHLCTTGYQALFKHIPHLSYSCCCHTSSLYLHNTDLSCSSLKTGPLILANRKTWLSCGVPKHAPPPLTSQAAGSSAYVHWYEL